MTPPAMRKMLSQPIATLRQLQQSPGRISPIIGLLLLEWALIAPHQVVEHLHRLVDSPISGALVAWNGFVSFALRPATVMLIGGVGLYYLSRHRGVEKPDLWGSVCAWGYGWVFHCLALALAASTRLFGVEEPFALIHQAHTIEPLLGILLEVMPVFIVMALAFGRRHAAAEAPPPSKPIPLTVFTVVMAVLVAATSATVIHMSQIEHTVKPLVSDEKLPSFPLVPFDGSPQRSSDQLRGKVVLIDVWATWCGPCVATMPYMQSLYTDLAGTDFELISLNVEAHNRPAVKAFIDKHDLTFPVYIDAGPAQEALKIRMFPTTVLVDRKGTIQEVDVGVTSVAGLRGEVEALLAAE
mgnify:CR=1 FL=1